MLAKAARAGKRPGGVVTDDDLRVVAAQLGRAPRAVTAVAHRCPCGLPDVVQTAPRLADGTPFPTLFYLTCPRATAAVSRLESGGLMHEMGQRLALSLRYVPPRRMRTGTTWPGGRGRGSGRPARAAARDASAGSMPAGSSACTPWSRTSWPSRARTRSAGRPLTLPGSGGGALRHGGRRVNGAAATRVAAIDCGTNSLRLLIADVDPVAGQLTELDRRMEIVRLGQGVAATGRLAAEALDRTLRALAGYAAILEDLSVTAVRMVATSATRDAANSSDLCGG